MLPPRIFIPINWANHSGVLAPFLQVFMDPRIAVVTIDGFSISARSRVLSNGAIQPKVVISSSAVSGPYLRSQVCICIRQSFLA